jgi:uncharacterized tellurite resistance protein B-like protein
MLTKLREFILGLGSQNFEQNQNEAILTMLVWVMQADGKIEPGENSKLSDFVMAVKWESEISPTLFIQQAKERVAAVEQGEMTEEALLAECAKKLKGPDIRYKAVKVCHELAKSDNYFDAAEKHLLKLFSKTLM